LDLSPKNIPGFGRILALDLGKKRIGIAVSDPLGITARGLPTFERVNIRTDLSHLATVAESEQVTRVVVGNPKHLSGAEGRQSEWARDFANRLAEFTGLPVVLWDERWTSVEANRVLDDSGMSRAKRRAQVDKLAAVLLLENYLDAQANALQG
jgi:putative Holliday junction resolvase